MLLSTNLFSLVLLTCRPMIIFFCVSAGYIDMSKEDSRDEGLDSKKTKIDNVDDVDSDNEDPTGRPPITSITYQCYSHDVDSK